MDVFDILRSKNKSIDEFVFENLTIPPMWCYLTPQDVENLRKIATSLRLSSKVQEKYRMIDDIMRARGFRRFSRGTNRVVYSYLEDTRFVVKIAVDKVGMQDNPREFRNQHFLQPFVTKMFYVSPCGTVGFAERVKPISNIEEFREIADDVFYMLVYNILGEYVVEDCGNKFFKNYGVRLGCGPVLLDYPYIYKLDGSKLICNHKDPDTGIVCGGEIGYDDGLNYLLCQKCGCKYLASDLKDDNIINKMVKKGGNKMKVRIVKGNKTLVSNDINVDEVMERRRSKREEIKNDSSISVRIVGGGTTTQPKAVLKNSNVKPAVPKDITLSVKVVGGNSKGTVSKDVMHGGANKRNLDLDPDSTLKATVTSIKPVEEEIEEPSTPMEETSEVEEVATVETNTEVSEEKDNEQVVEEEKTDEVSEAEETPEVEDETPETEEELPKKTTRKKADPESKRSTKKAEKKAVEVDEPSIDENAYNDVVEKANQTINKRTKTRKSMKKMIEDEEMEDMKIIKAKKTSKTRKSTSKSNFIPSKE